MRKLILIFLVLCVSAEATTTLRLHRPPSTVSGYQTMSLSVGPANGGVQTSITNTTASGTSIQTTQTGGGTTITGWMSEPFSGSVTLSGTETCNIYGKEASAANNATYQCQFFKYSGGSLGSVFCTATAASEWTTSIATKAATCTASSTAFAAGDQLVVKIFITNFGTMGAGSPGVTLDYDGPTASADGDSNVVLAETASFNPYAAGTLIVVEVTGGSQTDTYTVTDDQSNVYQLGSHGHEDSNGGTDSFYYTCNAAVGTRKVTVTPGGTNFQFTPRISVWANVAGAACLDVSTTNAPTTTTITAGSVTPNYTNDLLIQGASNTNGATSVTWTQGSQTNCAWQMLQLASTGSNLYATQFCVYGSTSAINPTMTVSASTSAASPAVAFRSNGTPTLIGHAEGYGLANTSITGSNPFFISPPAATVSGVPAGMRVMGIEHNWNTQNAPYNSNPRTTQFPIFGNTGCVLASTANTDHITGITSSPSATWAATGPFNNVGGDPGADTWCAYNLTPGLYAITVTFNALGTGGSNTFMYDVSGAKPSSAALISDSGTTLSGTQAVAGPVTFGSITPAASGEVLLLVGGVANTTLGFASGSTCTGSDNWLYTGEPDPDGYDENNPWQNCVTTSTSSVTFTATNIDGLAAGKWVAKIIELGPPSAGPAFIQRRR